MYVLNVLFDFNRTDGRILTRRVPNHPLDSSMCWLSLAGPEPADPNPPAFLPEPAQWDNLGEAATLLLPSQPDPGSICIRVQADEKKVQVPGAQLQLAVSFGRPVRARQEQASPFTEDGTAAGCVKTTFIKTIGKRNTPQGWWLPLGTIARYPRLRNLTHRYEFSMGLIVISGGVTRYFGEDPEMDIGQ